MQGTRLVVPTKALLFAHWPPDITTPAQFLRPIASRSQWLPISAQCASAYRVELGWVNSQRHANCSPCGMQTKSEQFKREQIRPRARKPSRFSARPVAAEVAAGAS